VQARTRVLVWQAADDVGCREGETFGDGIHSHRLGRQADDRGAAEKTESAPPQQMNDIVRAPCFDRVGCDRAGEGRRGKCYYSFRNLRTSSKKANVRLGPIADTQLSPRGAAVPYSGAIETQCQPK
jgi:hypothetical protein